MTVDGRVHAGIGQGLLVLVAAGSGDVAGDAQWLAGKVARLRIFADADGRMNRSVAEVDGEVLAVSQFTLYGDVSRGNRPGFTGAAPPEVGEALVEAFVEALRAHRLRVQTGVFGAHMLVGLVNDGPVTIWLESPPGAAAET